MIPRYILLLIVLKEFPMATQGNENDKVICYIDFDIFVSHGEQFCDNTEKVTGSLRNGIYFQYKTNNNRTWITADIYNATKSVKESVIEFQATDVQFRWIQFDTIGSPVWAIDEILFDCPFGGFFKSISFEEDPEYFNKFFTCHSGFLQHGTKHCSHTEYSLLMNGTNRELRTISFDLFDDTSEEMEGGNPDHCQPQVCLGPSLSHGLVWSTMDVNKTARIQCSEISGSFWTGLYATRKCLDGGVWDGVDVSQCTIKDTNEIPFIVYSTYLQLLDNSSLSTLNQLQQSLDVYNINATINLTVYLEEKFPFAGSVILAAYTLTFNDMLEETKNTMINVAKHLAAGNYSTIGFEGFPEVVIMHSVDVCQCNNSFTVEEEQQKITMANICVGISLPPCIPDNSDIGSKCNEPHYRGDNTNCAIINTDDAYDCSQGLDMQFGIRWEGSTISGTVTRMCPNGTGITSRLCDSNGNWQVPDVRSCNSTKFYNLFERVCNIVSSAINGNELNNFLMDFAAVITQTNFSLLPRDLIVANNVIGKTLTAVEENPFLLKLEELNITEQLLNIFDSIFDGKNEPGFMQLMQIDQTENQMLINHSEKFGMLLANNIDTENDEPAEMNFIKDNFVLSVQKSSVKEISFRPQINGHNQTSIHIPAQLLEEKPKDANGMVPVVHVAYKTLHRFLPDTNSLNGLVKKPVSMIISSQVGNRNTPSLLPQNNPVILQFDHNAPNNISNITRCAFWNFDLEHTGGDGGWDSTNVEVAQKSHDGHIVCHSLHLTCFVVLVDVSGGTGGQLIQEMIQKTEEENTDLSIVIYIGCGILMIFLLIVIAFLIIYGKTFLSGVHNFIHLNLSIAILLALIVFVAGIETATNNEIACTVVAALLHYLFTAVFSWMLCEGILLYILLVKVFTCNFIKKWWPYFILGWGIPVPIVATAVGIAHRHYGNDEFCWVSTDDGTIWAFVGPMILIIMVNIIFLIMVLGVLFKSRSQSMSSEKAKEVKVVKSLIPATIVLLPLLGVTWVFGLLAVNRNLSVFAWIFAVLNSLQGLLILFFYVLKNKKVRQKIITTAVACTPCLKTQSKSKKYLQDPTPQSKTGHSLKTNESGNPVKVIDDTICYVETTGTYDYSSERENSLTPSLYDK